MPAAPRKTLAMVQTAPRKLEPRELPIPDLTDDTALLRIEACGICGSDYEQYEGVLRTPMPAIPGHEPLGVIEAIGDAAVQHPARVGVLVLEGKHQPRRILAETIELHA